ncbi:MAG: cobaltochelatase subunit CobN [Deltaproteobacteria bacterium]|nr:cobaltochelatase subunit CobN [Deltaproteobacteria bacterium]
MLQDYSSSSLRQAREAPGTALAARCAVTAHALTSPNVTVALVLAASTAALAAAALVIASSVPALAADVSMIVSDSDSMMVHEFVDVTRFADGVSVKVFCLADLLDDDDDDDDGDDDDGDDGGGAAGFVGGSEAVLVDVMDHKLTLWVRERGLPGKPGVALYALRRSGDDERLRSEGYVFDEDLERYYYYLTESNVLNAVRRALSLKLVPGLAYGPPEGIRDIGVYHPEAPESFGTADAFFEWYRSRPGYSEDRPWVAVMFFETFLLEGQKMALEALVRVLEDEGLNVMPAFGRDLRVLEELLLDDAREGRVDAVAAFNLKFYMSYSDGLKEALADLGVPVFNAINLYSLTIGEWRASPQGLPATDVVWNLDSPETSGVIEPNLLSGKVEARSSRGARVYRWDLMEDEARHMARRIRRHAELARKPAPEKKVAILYYNSAQDKHGIAASYLNVFRSLADILARLQAEGYAVDADPPLDEEQVKDLVLRGGRNVGSWAPGELDALVESGTAVMWPVSEYRELFDGLPEEFRRNVLDQWGPPEETDIMAKDGKLVLPVIARGNVLMIPQASMAYGDDLAMLYHETLIYPHHQYLAVYLWLEHVWKADAVVHLGSYGTLEWMPGKQAGLALSDSPEVLTGTLPNIYPFNMDVLAEGIQAKRRGRAVLIDHLIPPLVRAGLYREFLTLSELTDSYRAAAARDSATAGVYLGEIRELVSALGLERELGLDAIDGPEAVRALSEYLERLDRADVPYGLHTFGTGPSGEAAESLLDAMARENPGLDMDGSRRKLDASGPNEFAGLLRGLSGRWVEPGEGKDPARNPNALPTGRNFYAISPGRLPTREAWRLGQEAADRMISDYVSAHGEYPDKVAVVVWALEAMRNEGVNESTVLALIGVEPQWASSGMVTGTRPIPGRELGRPRIDVTVDASGLYRDVFPDRIMFLDEAIRQAALQDDVENFIARNDAGNREALLARGYSEEDAGRFSRARVFSERPATYGNRVSDVIASSGTWDDPGAVALTFREHTGYAYGTDVWGEPARDSLELNLAGSKIAWHSLSSHLYGVLDSDEFNGYLGGLAAAIASLSEGAAPETLVTDQRSRGKALVTGLDDVIGAEMRARYLNPVWIRGMKEEGYAGAGQMSAFVDNLFAYQVTVPQDVDPGFWDRTYEVYVEDWYGDGIAEFMERDNPWAYQSLTGRMLEAVRKGYWDPSDEVRRRLAVEYATSVIERGASNGGYLSNNPRLNLMVVDIVSQPGVMAPESVERFRDALEQVTRKTLEDQLAKLTVMLKDLGDRRAVLDSNPPSPAEPPSALEAAPPAVPEAAPPAVPEAAPPAVPEAAPPAVPEAPPPAVPETTPPTVPETAPQTQAGSDRQTDETSEGESVRGLKMENVSSPSEDASPGSPGIEWTLSVFVLALLAIFFVGYRRRAGRAKRDGGVGTDGNGAASGPGADALSLPGAASGAHAGPGRATEGDAGAEKTASRMDAAVGSGKAEAQTPDGDRTAAAKTEAGDDSAEL